MSLASTVHRLSPPSSTLATTSRYLSPRSSKPSNWPHISRVWTERGSGQRGGWLERGWLERGVVSDCGYMGINHLVHSSWSLDISDLWTQCQCSLISAPTRPLTTAHTRPLTTAHTQYTITTRTQITSYRVSNARLVDCEWHSTSLIAFLTIANCMHKLKFNNVAFDPIYGITLGYYILTLSSTSTFAPHWLIAAVSSGGSLPCTQTGTLSLDNCTV